MQNDLRTTRLAEVADDDGALFLDLRRRTTRPTEVAADEEALFSYQVLSRRRTTRPAVVAADEVTLFLVPEAMKTADDAGKGDYINTVRPIANIINPVPEAQSSQGFRHVRGGCRQRAAVDRGAEFAKMTPVSTSSSRHHGG